MAQNTYARSLSPALNTRDRPSYAQAQCHSTGGLTPTPHQQLCVETSCLRVDAMTKRQVHTITRAAPLPEDVTPTAKPWSLAHDAPQTSLLGSNETVQKADSYSVPNDGAKSLKWSDSDFPPLDVPEGDGRTRKRGESSRLSWNGGRLPSNGHDLPASPASSLSVNPSTTPVRSRSHSGIPTEASPLRRLDPAEPHSKRTSNENPIQMSPDRYAAPHTPRSGQFPIPSSVRQGEGASGHSFSHDRDLQHSFEHTDTPRRPASLGGHGQEWFASDKPRVDPTTVFVGGLDVYNDDVWDESHLTAIFAQYGRIENIQVVRPRK